MGNSFNQDINLPEGLESFIMGNSFIKPINLPDSLKHFTMGDSFYDKNLKLKEGLKVLRWVIILIKV